MKKVVRKGSTGKPLKIFIGLIAAFVLMMSARSQVSAETGTIVYSTLDITNQRANLYTMAINGIPEQLTPPQTGYFDLSPVWSPNGQYVAYIREHLYGVSALYVIGADGKEKTLIYEDSLLSDPTWSPDSKSLAFVIGNDPTFIGRFFGGCSGNGQIATFSFEDSKTTIHGTTNNGTDPSWSPDGNQIAFTKTGTSPGIYALQISTGTVNFLFSEPDFPADPEWSPDGTKIVYGRNYPLVYTCNGGMKTGGLPNPQAVFGGEIVIRTLATGVSETIVNNFGSSPQWSPTGQNIIFSKSANGMHELFTVNSLGGTPLQINNSHSWETGSSWK